MTVKKKEKTECIEPQWNKINVPTFAKNVFRQILGEGTIKKVQDVVLSWNNPKAAILILSELPQIAVENRNEMEVDLNRFEKSLKSFLGEVERCGIGKLYIFPRFVPALRKMLQAYKLDRLRVLFRSSIYPAKKIIKERKNDTHILRLLPRMGGGQPTTALRDFVVAGSVQIIQREMSIKSVSRAIDKLLPLLKLCGGPNEKDTVQKIVQRSPDVVFIEPPSFSLVKEYTAKLGK